MSKLIGLAIVATLLANFVFALWAVLRRNCPRHALGGMPEPKRSGFAGMSVMMARFFLWLALAAASVMFTITAFQMACGGELGEWFGGKRGEWLWLVASFIGIVAAFILDRPLRAEELRLGRRPRENPRGFEVLPPPPDAIQPRDNANDSAGHC